MEFLNFVQAQSGPQAHTQASPPHHSRQCLLRPICRPSLSKQLWVEQCINENLVRSLGVLSLCQQWSAFRVVALHSSAPKTDRIANDCRPRNRLPLSLACAAYPPVTCDYTICMTSYFCCFDPDVSTNPRCVGSFGWFVPPPPLAAACALQSKMRRSCCGRWLCALLVVYVVYRFCFHHPTVSHHRYIIARYVT